MLEPIRVEKRNTQKNHLRSGSRINFSKMYTVEHNTKVEEYGEVHAHWKDLLVKHWIRVMNDSRTG